MSDVLRDLARAKALFQLRAIETIITAQAGEADRPRRNEDCGSVHEHAVGNADAPKRRK